MKKRKMKIKTKIGIIITILIIIISGLLVYQYSDKFYLFYRDDILKVTKNITIENNEYYKNRNYIYVQNTNDFIAKNETHLMNIIYSIINSGNTSFTFYCDENYKTCINDFERIIGNQTILSNINNFVHPYNSFKKITATYDSYGKITIILEKLYNSIDINNINNIVNKILEENINDQMSIEQKIQIIHDYIINNGNYSISDNNTKYNKASDILINGTGICSAYADAMAIFLEKLNLNNYKIASTDHIWNLVYVDNKWLHIDLTWDDPVSEDGIDHLERNTLLITNKRLKQIDNTEHNFDENVYAEGK